MATSSQQGGIGCFSVIGIIFVVLKVLGVQPVAAWSWWWVTAPFWGPLLFGLVIFALMAIVATVASR